MADSGPKMVVSLSKMAVSSPKMAILVPKWRILKFLVCVLFTDLRDVYFYRVTPICFTFHILFQNLFPSIETEAGTIETGLRK
jgi:hypothetical protein